MNTDTANRKSVSSGETSILLTLLNDPSARADLNTPYVAPFDIAQLADPVSPDQVQHKTGNQHTEPGSILLSLLNDPSKRADLSSRITNPATTGNTRVRTPVSYSHEKKRTHERKRMKRVGSALGLVAIATTAFLVAPVTQKALTFGQPKIESTGDTTKPIADQQSNDLKPLSVVWNAKKLGHTIQSAASFTIPETTTPELIEKAGTLKIRPQPNFLTREGALVSPDYILSLPTTGATIFGYERPQEEEELIYDGVNKSVLNTLTAAQVPQQKTPQVEAYAAANPSYKPPWETQYKGYRSSDLQPTAMHQFSTQDDLPLSPYPGELGGSAYFETHYQTYGRGGGTLPALKPGDPLVIERKIDDNIYTFAYVGSETIEVNKADGSLTPAEIKRQMDRGYGPDVTFDQIARTWQGHENQITATLQACNGSTQRVLYRFDLVDQKLTTKWID